MGEGDRLLWLRADARLRVVVLGLEGEPYLRFSPAGVEINEHAPTAYLNSYSALAVPAGINANSRPYWRRLTSGHTYLWPEDRLHELDLAARVPGAGGYVGHWTVPLRIDGKRAAIGGSLIYAPAPSPAWWWPLVVVLACMPALLRLRRPSVDALSTLVLSCLALLAFVVGQLGRDLYGRPEISLGQQAGLGVSLLLAAGALMLLRLPRWRSTAAVAIGLMGVWEGLTMRETLLNGFVLAALPAAVVRCAAIAALAAGVGAALIPLFGGELSREWDFAPGIPDRREAGQLNMPHTTVGRSECRSERPAADQLRRI